MAPAQASEDRGPLLRRVIAEGIEGRSPGTLARAVETLRFQIADDRLPLGPGVDSPLDGGEPVTHVSLQLGQGFSERGDIPFDDRGEQAQQDEPAEPFGQRIGDWRELGKRTLLLRTVEPLSA